MNSIGNYAFSECISLSSLSLPEGLTTIGQSSFSFLKISSITIPSTVQDIKDSAFFKCLSLASVIFAPTSLLKAISSNVFLQCPITQIVVPPNANSVSGIAFNVNPYMQSIIVDPANTYLWGDGKAVYNTAKTLIYYCASALQGEYKVLDGVTQIGNGCFCSSRLTKIILPETVKTISSYGFANSEISSVNLPNSISFIGRAAFYNTKNLSTIQLPTSIKTVSYEMFLQSYITKIEVPEGVTTIEKSAFAFCPKLTEVKLPSTLTELGGGVIMNSNLAKYSFPDNSNIYILDEVLLMDSMNTTISQYFGTDQTKLVIPSTVKTIRANAFKNKVNLKTIESDGNLQLDKIEEYAFNNCKNLQTIEGLNSVQAIERYAFYATALSQSLDFGSNLKYLNENCFSLCYNIPSLTFSSETPLTIGNEAFSSCRSISTLYFEGCTAEVTLGNNCFNGLEALTNLNIPRVINQIGYNCFAACGLKSVTVSDNSLTMENIPVGLFMNCSNLMTFSLPRNIKNIGPQALMNTNISEAIIPDTLEVLGQQCFKGCMNLKTINIGDGSALLRIDYGVFDGCISFANMNSFSARNFVSDYGAIYSADKTKMIVYPPASPSNFFALADKVTYLAESAFIGCINLQSVLIPDGSVKTIGPSCFEGCINLKNINIPMSVKEIGENAFLGCSNLICGSVIFQNKTPQFKRVLHSAGLTERVLNPCLAKTCKATYYSFTTIPVMVFILM